MRAGRRVRTEFPGDRLWREIPGSRFADSVSIANAVSPIVVLRSVERAEPKNDRLWSRDWIFILGERPTPRKKPHLRWEFPGLPIPRRIANEARRWRVKKLLTMTRMPPKSLLFLAESNLVEAANTSSSASRRTRRARVMSGVCDYCSSAEALVCCRADSARLCLSCDAWVRPCPLGKRRPARFSAALRWVRHPARGDRARAAFERARGASARPSRLLDVFHSLCPVRHPEMTRKAARVAFSGPRVTSLTVAGARIFFPDRMALTADPSAPRRRCTARIRWRDDTSAPGYAIIVGARPEWCVPVLPSPPSRARSFHLAAGARARR